MYIYIYTHSHTHTHTHTHLLASKSSKNSSSPLGGFSNMATSSAHCSQKMHTWIHHCVETCANVREDEYRCVYPYETCVCCISVKSSQLCGNVRSIRMERVYLCETCVSARKVCNSAKSGKHTLVFLYRTWQQALHTVHTKHMHEQIHEIPHKEFLAESSATKDTHIHTYTFPYIHNIHTYTFPYIHSASSDCQIFACFHDEVSWRTRLPAVVWRNNIQAGAVTMHRWTGPHQELVILPCMIWICQQAKGAPNRWKNEMHKGKGKGRNKECQQLGSHDSCIRHEHEEYN